jgi:peptidoglycan hydrolase-like protein with peptidoglycan-binding domain
MFPARRFAADCSLRERRVTIVPAPEIKVRRTQGDNRGADRARRIRLPAVLRLLLRRPRECLLATAGTTAAAAIIVNGLMLQPGPHPAPIFAIGQPVRAPASNAIAPTRARGPVAEIIRSDPAARPRADVIADIQRELSRRGFYDAPVDGNHGAKTDAAIREFEQSTGLKPTGEASEGLLQGIVRTPATLRPAVARKDPIAGLIASSRQLTAIQRALSDFGYGPLETNGILGPDTRAAIERFERDRKMPVTGQVSERLARELSAMTGRPL